MTALRILLLAALLDLAVPAQAAMPTPPATSDKLEQLATIVEGMRGPSRIVDQRIADMIRVPAAAENIIIPAVAPAYTQFPASAAKLRPKGWLIGTLELNNGWVVSTVDKWDANGDLAATHEKGGRNNCGCSAAGALALTEAMLRAWAQDLREAGQ